MKNRRQFISLTAKSILATVTFGVTTISKAKPSLKTGLVLDEGFLHHHISPNHPESPARYQAILQQIKQTGLLDKAKALTPIENAENYLGLIHSQQHIDTIKMTQEAMHSDAVLATAGVLSAVDAVCKRQVKNAFCASRPPGHHAKNTGQEEGFCYYNHIAIAARYAQQQYGLKKVLIIDWDYHHGNGTEWAFYSDPSILYFSTHDMFAYPGTGFAGNTGQGDGKGFNINVHLDCGSTDKDIINAFKENLLPAVESFKPDLILISAGFDSRKQDLLGCFDISDHGFMMLTNMVSAMADKHCNGKVISMLEGGYNLQGNASAVSTHIHALMAG